MIARLLDRIFGTRCDRCWQRVRPSEQHLHDKDCD